MEFEFATLGLDLHQITKLHRCFWIVDGCSRNRAKDVLESSTQKAEVDPARGQYSNRIMPIDLRGVHAVGNDQLSACEVLDRQEDVIWDVAQLLHKIGDLRACEITFHIDKSH